ncbi:C-terminal helicase domain-containing protein [Capillimicrobium parvum]|uniref:C-terminal helicase domain-containing protein n=1 Tax=Capillimicrobium parvum TaxID=2884022 RepID=UPI003898E8C8
MFTAFRRTLDHLAQRAAEHALAVVRYHGGLARTEKDAAIASFADGASILLSTEAGGEGRNLQLGTRGIPSRTSLARRAVAHGRAADRDPRRRSA